MPANLGPARYVHPLRTHTRLASHPRLDFGHRFLCRRPPRMRGVRVATTRRLPQNRHLLPPPKKPVEKRSIGFRRLRRRAANVNPFFRLGMRALHDRTKSHDIQEPPAPGPPPLITVSFRRLDEARAGPCRELHFLEVESSTGDTFWSHHLFRGPSGEPVQVWHAFTFAQSEVLARKFLNEPIVGFDCEWPGHESKLGPLRKRIHLVQLACEDKIAIFHMTHIAAHTTDQLFAPSLRKIIESPDIAKAGVSVFRSDFLRLYWCFGLNARGSFELNLLDVVLDGLVDADASKGLDHLVQKYMGLPFHPSPFDCVSHFPPHVPIVFKAVYCSKAASDAYAGYMLFHHLNRRRLELDIVPPLPLYSEWQRSHGQPYKEWLRLHLPDNEGGGAKAIRATAFLDMAKSIQSCLPPTRTEKRAQTIQIWNLLRDRAGEDAEAAPARFWVPASGPVPYATPGTPDAEDLLSGECAMVLDDIDGITEDPMWSPPYFRRPKRHPTWSPTSFRRRKRHPMVRHQWQQQPSTPSEPESLVPGAPLRERMTQAVNKRIFDESATLFMSKDMGRRVRLAGLHQEAPVDKTAFEPAAWLLSKGSAQASQLWGHQLNKKPKPEAPGKAPQTPKREGAATKPVRGDDLSAPEEKSQPSPLLLEEEADVIISRRVRFEGLVPKAPVKKALVEPTTWFLAKGSAQANQLWGHQLRTKPGPGPEPEAPTDAPQRLERGMAETTRAPGDLSAPE